MTISKSIIQWLYNHNIEIERIDTGILSASEVAYALSKEPTSVVEEFVDGSQLRTEYYTFLSRRPTQFDAERIDNDKFFEDLENLVDELNFEGDLPILDGNRYCENIAVSSSFYLFETKESESIYSLTFEITYRKER